MCVANIIVNPGLVAFCVVDGSRFKMMFVPYATNVYDFKLGCNMILFADDTYLSEPYKGTLVAACTLDADNHLFNFWYGIVCGEKIEKWVVLRNDYCVLGVLKLVIMLGRNPGAHRYCCTSIW